MRYDSVCAADVGVCGFLVLCCGWHLHKYPKLLPQLTADHFLLSKLG